MKKIYQNVILRYIDDIFIFILCLFVFKYILQYVPTDLQAHINHIIKINSGESTYPPHFLYFFTINFFSAFTKSTIVLYRVTIVVLSFATTAKYSVAKRIILDSHRGASKGGLILITVGLFFCFSIPDFYNVFISRQLYIGRIVPMVWHNSTTILLFPFAILLFWKQLKMLDVPSSSKGDILGLCSLVIINILIKPSFILVYLPVTFFMILRRFKAEYFKQLVMMLSPLVVGGVLILAQYYFIYDLQYGFEDEESNHIGLSTPFKVLSIYIPYWYIPIVFLLSLALPIFCVFAFKEILKFKPFLYSLYLTIFGIVISAFLIESGPRMAHGNFIWQNIICAYLLMLSTVLFLVPKFSSYRTQKSKKTLYAGLIFLLHGLSGILYLVKIVITQNYY